MSKKVLIVLAVLISVTSFSVFAQEQVDYFAKWDVDANGSLSEQEFTDGYTADIPGTEYETTLGAGASAADLFSQADADGNGELSAEEWNAAVEQI